ncbi:MAG: hypothetical protein DRP42_00480 [Tenericutes bacterium]|nr:MAG: hypothetical protein DRP42_00480 [Mycoplasmatota bacterium]
MLPVSNEHHLEYATSINEVLLENNIRSSIDSSDERLSFKIRKHQTAKTSIEVIIGDKEIESKTVTFRRHGAEDSSTVTMEEFTNLILEEIK